MEYRKAAEEFCLMRICDARKTSQIENSISVKGESNILLFLANCEGRCLAGQISKGLGLSTSRVTIILNNLEKKGLIEKERDTEDRRKVYITLTEKGRELILVKHNEVVDNFERIFRELGKEDTEEYIRIMGRLFKIMEKKGL